MLGNIKILHVFPLLSHADTSYQDDTTCKYQVISEYQDDNLIRILHVALVLRINTDYHT